MWQAATRSGRFQGHSDGVLSVAFAPDGRTARAASLDKTIRLWDVESAQELQRFTGHEDVWTVAFSPDGGRALSAGGGFFKNNGPVYKGNDFALRLWRLPEPRRLSPTRN